MYLLSEVIQPEFLHWLQVTPFVQGLQNIFNDTLSKDVELPCEILFNTSMYNQFLATLILMPSA